MIAIIADIHGNYPALKAVLNEIDFFGCKTIISLGDVAGYYCMINECIQELRFRNVISLLGNHDYYLVSNINCPRSNSANHCLEYQRKIITNDNLKWLAKLKPHLLLNEISFVHGGWDDPLDEYMDKIEKNYFCNRKENFFVSGHTHVQNLIKINDNKFYCNPGSVGQPRDGDARAAFAIYEKGIFTLRRVDYEIEVIAKQMERVGFDSYYYQNLYSGSRLGGTLSI